MPLQLSQSSLLRGPEGAPRVTRAPSHSPLCPHALHPAPTLPLILLLPPLVATGQRVGGGVSGGGQRQLPSSGGARGGLGAWGEAAVCSVCSGDPSRFPEETASGSQATAPRAEPDRGWPAWEHCPPALPGSARPRRWVVWAGAGGGGGLILATEQEPRLEPHSGLPCRGPRGVLKVGGQAAQGRRQAWGRRHPAGWLQAPAPSGGPRRDPLPLRTVAGGSLPLCH